MTDRAEPPANDPPGPPAAGPARAPAPRPPASQRPAPRPARASPVRRALRVAGVLALGLLVGVAAAAWGLWLVLRDLPLADVLPPLDEPTLRVVLGDGGTLTTRGGYRAPYVGIDGLPAHLVDAVIAVEDRRFREHRGVDLRGIARALVRNLRAGGVVEGGSTITQQLVKVLYLGPERTLGRKLQEAVLAVALDRQLGKDRVIELYLNSVYLGSGAYGMPEAAETYFGQDVGALSLAEAALLAASIQAPSQVNPRADLAAARERGALVISLMAAQGLIGDAERQVALAELAAIEPEAPSSRAGSYFADWVLGQLDGVEGASGGIVATATLDPALQAAAERAVRDVLGRAGPAARAGQAAVVAMTPDGQVRAMVGGVDYEASQFNRATAARRQPASTFALFVFLAALASGMTPDDTVSDAPLDLDGYEPRNPDGRFHGEVTLREAFAQGYNVAAVRLAQAVGLEAVVEAARRFGIGGELRRAPSLALGTSEVTLLDMTEAYAAVALGRAPVRATGVSSLRFGEEGAALQVRGQDDLPQVRLARTRAPMIEMLQAVVAEGTGRAAAVPGFAAGKTGTTQGSRDAWFIGFTDTLVIGVWVGNDDNAPMDGVTGGGLPAEIWREVALAAGAPRAARPAAAQPAAAGPQCDVRACSQAYRSFDAADCTYQPVSGPRRVCTR